MTSVLSNESIVTLLSQPKQPNIKKDRSRSKRLYTFIHYKHSSHPRCFVILFFTIIIISLALFWLIAGLIRLRQTASYLESCAAGKVQCAADTNLTCSLSSSLCLCPDETFWDKDKRKCATIKTINEYCTTNEQCNTNKGLICHSDQTCKCPQNTYYTILGCERYLSIDSPCLTSGTQLCNSQLGLICNTTTNMCACPQLTYWTNVRCEPVSTYTGYCDRNSSCNAQVGLFCRLPSGTNTPCDCPLPSKLFTCDCEQGRTWFSSTGINSTSQCVNQGTYNGNCTSSSQCPQDLNLVCINGTCDCNVPLWFWSSTLNRCIRCESQGYTLIRYSSQWVCTRLIGSSLLTYTGSSSACAALGWSLISPIFYSDVLAIVDAYPTYRLWVNIQTTIGSSTYNNNLFPTNQTNWNTHVISSLTANYLSTVYALQMISSYNSTAFFEANTNLDMGHALCAIY